MASRRAFAPDAAVSPARAASDADRLRPWKPGWFWIRTGRRRAAIRSVCRPLRYWPVSESAALQEFDRKLPWNTTFAAGRAVAGTEVDDLVRGAHDAGFVLDDHHGVPGVAQLFEECDQPFGVARMQATLGSSSTKKRVHQPRAQAGGEVHALGFAAGKRARRAVQREIAQADLVEIAEPGRGPRSAQGPEDSLGRTGIDRPSAVMKPQGVADGQLIEIGQA